MNESEENGLADWRDMELKDGLGKKPGTGSGRSRHRHDLCLWEVGDSVFLFYRISNKKSDEALQSLIDDVCFWVRFLLTSLKFMKGNLKPT